MAKVKFEEDEIVIRVLPGDRISRKDVAAWLGVSQVTILKLERDKVLTAKRVLGRVFYLKDEVQRLVEGGA